jgi:RNA 2',3'-cyclic 3'-phosphodiesterase
MPRLFIAVDLPEPTRQALASLCVGSAILERSGETPPLAASARQAREPAERTAPSAPGTREPTARVVVEQDTLPGARWVGVDQMHLTLRFLGQVGDERVAILREQLAAVSATAFRIIVQSVGVFPPLPSRRKPARVLWAGVAPPGPLSALKHAIDEVLGPDPETAGRAFAPHVTLARFKDPPAPAALSRFLEEHRSFRLDPFAVEAFSLYESRTQPGGPVYTALARYSLHVH